MIGEVLKYGALGAFSDICEEYRGIALLIFQVSW